MRQGSEPGAKNTIWVSPKDVRNLLQLLELLLMPSIPCISERLESGAEAAHETQALQDATGVSELLV